MNYCTAWRVAASLLLATAVGCAGATADSRQPSAPSTGADGAPSKPPLLQVTGAHTHTPAGVTCHAWSVRVRNAKALTFRLHVIRNGERRVAQTVAYRWAKEDWRPEADAVAGQVLVLLQEGRPFGAKDRQRASLSV